MYDYEIKNTINFIILIKQNLYGNHSFIILNETELFLLYGTTIGFKKKKKILLLIILI